MIIIYHLILLIIYFLIIVIYKNITQYYKLNLEYYHVGGPLLFFMDDTTNGDTFIQSGLMVDIARDIGAALITYDRRYFGLNIPTEYVVLYR